MGSAGSSVGQSCSEEQWGQHLRDPQLTALESSGQSCWPRQPEDAPWAPKEHKDSPLNVAQAEPHTSPLGIQVLGTWAQHWNTGAASWLDMVAEPGRESIVTKALFLF